MGGRRELLHVGTYLGQFGGRRGWVGVGRRRFYRWLLSIGVRRGDGRGGGFVGHA